MKYNFHIRNCLRNFGKGRQGKVVGDLWRQRGVETDLTLSSPKVSSLQWKSSGDSQSKVSEDLAREKEVNGIGYNSDSK